MVLNKQNLVNSKFDFDPRIIIINKKSYNSKTE